MISPLEGAQFITHTFFEKQMNSPFTTLENSAMAYEDKKIQLSQEVVRRLMRVDKTRTQQEKNEIVDKYTDKLERSGYSMNQIRIIVETGIKTFMNKQKEAQQRVYQYTED